MEAARSIALIIVTKNGATGINYCMRVAWTPNSLSWTLMFIFVPRYPHDGLDLWLKNQL